MVYTFTFLTDCHLADWKSTENLIKKNFFFQFLSSPIANMIRPFIEQATPHGESMANEQGS
jgi:hypothetical protein